MFLLPLAALAGSGSDDAAVSATQDPEMGIWKAHSELITQYTLHTGLNGFGWVEANGMQALFDYYAAFGTTADDPVLNSILSTLRNYDFQGETNAYNDDRIWLALAAVRAYDLSNDAVFLDHAIFVQKHVSQQWTDQCGGGVPWKMDNPYKNTITNGLFFQLSAALWKRTTYFADDVNRSATWLGKSGLYNNQTYYDGLAPQADGTCSMQTEVFSYQLGPVIMGLLELGLTDYAMAYAVNSLPAFTDHETRVIVENGGCDQAQAEDACGPDMAIFKGIYTRALGNLVAVTGPNNLVADAISASMQSLVMKDLVQLDYSRVRFGLNWNGPSLRTDKHAQIIAMDLFNAFQRVYPQKALACLYNDVGLKGGVQCLRRPGYYDVAYNDAISSISLDPGCTLKAATDGGMQGNTKVFSSTAGWVGDDINDQISSMTLTCS